jgi:hypothetical protein
MLPETGGANSFTLRVADRLEALGRPATFDELIDDIARTVDLPWAWITQRHQAELARCRAQRPLAATGASGRFFDPALGWHVEGYDVNDRATKRAALSYCVRKVLSNTLRHKGSWAIRDPDGRWRRNPDAHPKVHANGKRHAWDPETRAASQAEHAAIVQAVNVATIDQGAERLTLGQRATVVRYLAGKLPADRRAAASQVVRTTIRDLDRVYADATPEQFLELLARYC